MTFNAALDLGMVAWRVVRMSAHEPSVIMGSMQAFRDLLQQGVDSAPSSATKDLAASTVQVTDEFMLKIKGWAVLDMVAAHARQGSLGKDVDFVKWANQMRLFKAAVAPEGS